MATGILKDFYAAASSATALVQASQRDPREGKAYWGEKEAVKMGSEEWKSLADPKLEGTVDRGHKAGMQTFGDTYKGQKEGNFGVLALLEVIASDFATLEADTRAAEVEGLKSHEDFMAESRKNKAVKERKVEMNNADRAA